MASTEKKISELDSETLLNDNDIFIISKKNGENDYTSKSICLSNMIDSILSNDMFVDKLYNKIMAELEITSDISQISSCNSIRDMKQQLSGTNFTIVKK